jgi:hypothetical protein
MARGGGRGVRAERARTRSVGKVVDGGETFHWASGPVLAKDAKLDEDPFTPAG